MKTGKRRAAAAVLAVFMAFACAGCMAEGVDGLYSLPQMSEEYVQLQELISQRIAEGGEYAAPTGGSHRQSVQLQDLDGDGTAEAVAFLADSDHTPSVCIYRRDEQGEFYLYMIISGQGSSVAGVEYADLNGDGACEMVIVWQISGDMQLLSAYTFSGTDQVELLGVDCQDFAVYDLDGDGACELLDLCAGSDGANGTVVMYDVAPDNQVISVTAALSGAAENVQRLLSGTLSDGTAALFVENSTDSGLTTDVFISRDGQLVGLTDSSGTLRNEDAFCTDIDGDSAIEVPVGEGDVLRWYGLDANGNWTLALTTFHDYEEGWYLTLSGPLLEEVSVTRQDDVAGETAVTFSAGDTDAGGGRELLTIYILTGENRRDRASAGDRFLLCEEGTTVYAAVLLTDELTQENITDNFNLIYPDWQTGDM